MNKIEMNEVRAGLFFDSEVYLDSKYIISTPDFAFTENTVKALRKWGFTNLYTEGSVTGSVQTDKTQVSGASLDQTEKEKEGLHKAQKFYDDLLDYTDSVFDKFRRTNSLNLNNITEEIKSTITMIKDNINYILRFSDLKNRHNRDYNTTHAVKTMILSLALAITIERPQKLAYHKVIEVGLCALLHELGMFQIPPKVYEKEGRLTPEEKKMITAHPILGYRLLGGLKDIRISQDILLGILQHHERINGTGYPQKLTDSQISLYGRIVGISCSYAAQISDRPHKDSVDGHTSMLSLLKDMEKLYDRDILTTLLSLLSLYPLGSYVILASGMIGTVVKTDPSKPKFPTVKIIADHNFNAVPEPSIVQTKESNKLYIARSLKEDEIEALTKKGIR